MGKLPMTKARRSIAFAVVVVTMMLCLLGQGIHTVYANHSTISSLKSKLSQKDQIIQDKDQVIHEKEAIIDLSTIQVQEKEKEVEEKAQQVEELQKQVSIKLEKEAKLIQMASVSYTAPKSTKVQASQESRSQFQDGWKASFYSLGVESTGKRPGQSGHGLTASGRVVQNGITIAVDPKQIPLGTWVEIEFPDGHVEKRRADDTGSAIKGNKIDIYMNAPQSTLMDLGIQKIKVRVLKGDQSM